MSYCYSLNVDLDKRFKVACGRWSCKCLCNIMYLLVVYMCVYKNLTHTHTHARTHTDFTIHCDDVYAIFLCSLTLVSKATGYRLGYVASNVLLGGISTRNRLDKWVLTHTHTHTHAHTHTHKMHTHIHTHTHRHACTHAQAHNTQLHNFITLYNAVYNGYCFLL